MKLYNRVNTNDQIVSGVLEFSDGSKVPVGKLQNDGQAGAVVTFPEKTVNEIRFVVTGVKPGSKASGLGAFEVYAPQ